MRTSIYCSLMFRDLSAFYLFARVILAFQNKLPRPATFPRNPLESSSRTESEPLCYCRRLLANGGVQSLHLTSEDV